MSGEKRGAGITAGEEGDEKMSNDHKSLRRNEMRCC